MTILYTVGRGSKHDNLELRMSLRSLEKFAAGVDRVVVVGCPPAWLSKEVDVLHVPPMSRNGPKQDNIMDAIFKAIDMGKVQGEFMLSSDDHFLVKPVDFTAFPYYYRRPKIRSVNDLIREKNGLNITRYKAALSDTRGILERHGYGAIEFCGHVNTHLHTDDAAVVREMWMETPHADFGYEPTCMFMNVRQKRDPVEPVYREDFKLMEPLTGDKFWKAVGDRNTFSVGDSVFDRKGLFEAFLMSLYPEKSKYEI